MTPTQYEHMLKMHVQNCRVCDDTDAVQYKQMSIIHVERRSVCDDSDAVRTYVENCRISVRAIVWERSCEYRMNDVRCRSYERSCKVYLEMAVQVLH